MQSHAEKPHAFAGLNWVWNKCERMESSLTLSYAEVPYFGFGVLGP